MKQFAANYIVFLGALLIVVAGQYYGSGVNRKLSHSYSILKGILLNITATKSRMNSIYYANKKSGKLQTAIPVSQPFFCDAKKGPGARSIYPPNSVNNVRPGDIDIIAAIGDSLTAGNGAMSVSLFDLLNENRGIAWSIGGRGDWRKYLTLPNILREFNPNLYGYSTDDSLSIDRASKFNVAEPMTQYEDMHYQAQVLLKRMKRDPLVNMKTHWKLITIFLGNNDICSKLCDMPYPLDIIKEHINYVYTTLRFLRNNSPRTVVNWVLPPNLVELTTIKSAPLQCYLAARVECRCIFSPLSTPAKLRLYEYIIRRMQKVQIDIINKDEFHSDTFTVNLQPFTYNMKIPVQLNADTNLRYLASDCFHFSQLGQAAAANALWNNMMQPDRKKQLDWMPVFKRFECPSVDNAFITTRENVKNIF